MSESCPRAATDSMQAVVVPPFLPDHDREYTFRPVDILDPPILFPRSSDMAAPKSSRRTFLGTSAAAGATAGFVPEQWPA